jgi:prepilin-type N-terminal cleavage/methylation domain-containing protein
MTQDIKQDGFTIVELIIATAVFSVILLICASGIIVIGKLFYKGIISTATQEVARSAIDDIKEDFELSGGYFVAIPPSSGYEGFCIGSHLYSYKIDQKINLDGTGHALVVRDYPSCDTSPPVAPDNFTTSPPAVQAQWRELLGANMRLGAFIVTPNSAIRPSGLAIDINVISGDDDLISVFGTCKGGGGSQFCANAPLSAYATRRLR